MQVSGRAPGRLVPYGRRPYYKPEPLPPGRELSLGSEFYTTLSNATFWLGKLSGISTAVEFSPVLYTSLLRKEAMESTQIEGAEVDMNTLYRHETRQPGAEASRDEHEAETKDVAEVLNYEQAVEEGVEALGSGGVSTGLLQSLHETLLTGVRSDTDTLGAFRRQPVNLGGFVPPEPGTVEGAMDALLTYIRTGGSYHGIVDIALVHYQFETIHPFGDGNGRLGRLLIALQLLDQGYLAQPNLYLSEFFNRNKETYVERLQGGRTNGAWEDWLAFFVRGVERQAHESFERSVELRTLHREYHERYDGRSRADARLALALFEQPYLTANDVQDILDVTGPTAYRAIHRLEDEGVLEEVTGKQRNREYRAADIFAVLERPPETY